MCTCGICGKPFPSHTALAEHIFRDHANRMFAAIIAALVIALALLRPANAQDTQPPSVGEPPTVAVEHKVFLPFISIDDGVDGRGRYWGGSAGQAEYVSWRPSGS